MKITSIRYKFDIWVRSWLELVCASISILTLTLYRPWWDFQWLCHATKRELQKKIDAENKQE